MSKDDKPDAWMPLYIGDWDGDTGHLDCEQDGAYGRLVRWYWRNGPPRDDDALLARIIRMDLKRWRKIRLVIAPFFQIVDGVWRHKRVDAELVRWAEKRRRAIERAAAGGRAKAAKSSATSSATSTQQAVLEHCTSASSREVDGPTGQSTLSGRERPEARREGASVPRDVRDAFIKLNGETWVASYVDPCGWQDVPERALIPATRYAASKILAEGVAVLRDLSFTLKGKAA